MDTYNETPYTMRFKYSKISLIRTNWERTLVQISESSNYTSATENMFREVIKWTKIKCRATKQLTCTVHANAEYFTLTLRVCSLSGYFSSLEFYDFKSLQMALMFDVRHARIYRHVCQRYTRHFSSRSLYAKKKTLSDLSRIPT
jgi:hypothetical protein